MNPHPIGIPYPGNRAPKWEFERKEQWWKPLLWSLVFVGLFILAHIEF